MELSVDRSMYGYDSYTDVGGTYLDPGTFKHKNNAFAFTLGERTQNNCGAQLTYTHVNNINRGNTKQYVDSLIIDGLYFVPMWRNLELRLLVGSGLYNIKFKTIYNALQYEQHKLTLGVRFGAGFQYNFNKQFFGNIEYKYQAPFDKIKYISGFSLGFGYNFLIQTK